jgi:hypothetical protein
MKGRNDVKPRPISAQWWKAIMAYLQPPHSKAAALRAAGFSEATALHHADRIFGDPRVRRFLELYYQEEERKRLAIIEEDSRASFEAQAARDFRLKGLTWEAIHDSIQKQ